MKALIFIYHYPIIKIMIRKKILIIDDDLGITEALKIVFEEYGYVVKIIDDKYEVLDKILKYKPDLIFLDIKIPGMNGLEACQFFKKNPIISKIPIIICSAQMDGEKQAKRAGADGFISKPFEINKLMEKISVKIKND